MAEESGSERTASKHSILGLQLKDIVQVGMLLGWILVFYFTQMRDADRRITILETKMQGLEANISELRSDVKAILSTVRGGRP